MDLSDPFIVLHTHTHIYSKALSYFTCYTLRRIKLINIYEAKWDIYLLHQYHYHPINMVSDKEVMKNIPVSIPLIQVPIDQLIVHV